LQDFNLDKRMENALKTVINKEGAQISAIPPNPYCNRYVKFMKNKVIIDQTAATTTNAGGYLLPLK